MAPSHESPEPSITLPIMATEVSVGVMETEDAPQVALSLTTLLAGGTYFLTRNQAVDLAVALKKVVKKLPETNRLAIPPAADKGLIVPGA